MFIRPVAAMIAVSLSAAAAAQLRDYCPDRPGLGTPSCTIDPGHFSFELGMADWTLDKSRAERTDRLILGDMLLRYGIAESSEVQLGWTSSGRERDHDRLSGTRTSQLRAGDATVALRRNLRNPDGSGLSIALMGFATLPAGRRPIGAGDWGAGLSAPISYAIDDRFSLSLAPEVDAAVDEDGDGRHLAYGGVAGLSAKLSAAVTAALEYQLTRDRDPSGSASLQSAGLSLGWQPRADLQLDLGAVGGLGHHVPDIEVYAGVSRRF